LPVKALAISETMSPWIWANRARSLPEDKKLSLSEVALTLGFSRQSHLVYPMRRHLGMSPMDTRKAMDAGNSA
jgi:AraC-like DNA-binding protein